MQNGDVSESGHLWYQKLFASSVTSDYLNWNKNTFDSIVIIINLLEGTTLLLSDVLKYSNGPGNGLLHVWKWEFIWKYVHDYLAICKKKANMLLL